MNNERMIRDNTTHNTNGEETVVMNVVFFVHIVRRLFSKLYMFICKKKCFFYYSLSTRFFIHHHGVIVKTNKTLDQSKSQFRSTFCLPAHNSWTLIRSNDNGFYSSTPQLNARARSSIILIYFLIYLTNRLYF